MNSGTIAFPPIRRLMMRIAGMPSLRRQKRRKRDDRIYDSRIPHSRHAQSPSWRSDHAIRETIGHPVATPAYTGKVLPTSPDPVAAVPDGLQFHQPKESPAAHVPAPAPGTETKRQLSASPRLRLPIIDFSPPDVGQPRSCARGQPERRHLNDEQEGLDQWPTRHFKSSTVRSSLLSKQQCAEYWD